MPLTACIVLITDFGQRDPYAGILKGVIFSIAPGLAVFDLTHGIEPQNIVQAGMMLKQSYEYFPDGAIFVAVVDPGVGTSRKIICVKTPRHYFVSPDNGLLSLALEQETILDIRSVRNSKYYRTDCPSSTFHGRDILSPVAAHLARSRKSETVFCDLGPRLKRMTSLSIPKIKKNKMTIEGCILYFDHFGNAVTNVEKGCADLGFWKAASVSVRNKNMGPLRKTYAEGPRRLCAVMNSFNYLEIAIPNASVEKKTHLRVGDPVIVRR